MASGEILVVVPTYEERDNIERLLRAVRGVVPTAEVLIVDDGSPDGTAEVAEAVGLELGGVHLLRRAAKEGLGSAYRDGFAWARHRGYGTVAQMDADLSHDPVELPAMLAASALGADLVVGSRYRPGGQVVDWPWSRRVLSRLGNIYASVLLGLHVSDSTSGYRVWRGTMLDQLAPQQVRADGYGFQVEMAYRTFRSGGTIVEVPIRFADRVQGTSKLDRSIILEAAAVVARLAWHRHDNVEREGALTSV
jgi:dolichol-phosphate mannosyltransferase